MRPRIILEFRNAREREYFIREYGRDVLSAIRGVANVGEVREVMKFELPPERGDGYYVRPESDRDEEGPERRYVIFRKGKEIEYEGEAPVWVYYFDRVI